jgi:hypothetical protein
MTPLFVLLALSSACAPGTAGGNGGTPGTDDGDGAGNGGNPGPGGVGDGSNGGSTGDDSGDSGSTGGDSGSGDSGSQPGSPVRFVVLGDAGTGDNNQFAVGSAMASVCAQQGCDFALYVGDNFYSDGVSALDDSQFQDKFEAPYAALDFPFYAVPGNHDYGGGGGGYDTWRTDLEVEYTTHSTKWTMPDQYYAFEAGNATFIGLDTTPLDWGNTQEESAWLPSELAAHSTTWKFAYGHHPYLSNGNHGNANGNFGPFVESNLCGNVDVYFSGHDHDLEWVQSDCNGTQFIVSGGGGAGLYGIQGSNPDLYANSTHGFLWVELDGDTFTGVFYDDQGNELYRHSFTKQL